MYEMLKIKLMKTSTRLIVYVHYDAILCLYQRMKIQDDPSSVLLSMQMSAHELCYRL